MQICYIGIHMLWWFAASIKLSSTLGISPNAIPPLATYFPIPLLPPHPPTGPSVWCSPPCARRFSVFISPYEWEHTVFGFLILCWFTENDGFQLHPCPCKGHELICLFYGCIVFHGIYVPHLLYPIYHWWAFGLVSSLWYCEQCCNKHTCACVFIVEWFIVLWIYTQ